MKKILSWILIFALIFGQLSAPITVLAQEATPSAEPSASPTPSPSPLPTPEATDSAKPTDPTPTPSTQPTETPTLTSTASPSATPTAEAFREPFINKVTEKAGEGRDKRWVEGEVIVKFKKDKTNLRSTLGDIKASAFESKHGLEKIDEIKDLNITVQKDDKPTQQLISELKKDPDVEYVEPNYYLKPRSLPNDTDFEKLWALHNTGQNIVGINGNNDADIDAPEAWDLEKEDQSDVIVAVIDTGVAYKHPDLASNMWDETNCKDNNNNVILGGCPNHGWDYQANDNNPDDDYGHGTHVAGTIAGISSNGVGISGVSSKNNLKIMALKVNLPKSNSFSLDAIIQSIYFAKNNGAKVINASFGGGGYSQLLKDAIAAFPGLFVAAAGNDDGKNNDQYPHYPSGLDNPNIIAVASTDQNDGLSSFSNYGPTSVDVGAPGSNILSTVPTILTNEIYYENFDSLTPPAIPNGYSKSGDWGTKAVNDGLSTTGGESGIALYGDINQPYNQMLTALSLPPNWIY